MFVATPNKMEGEGNSDLLTHLKTAEEKEKTNIDLDRSSIVRRIGESMFGCQPP